MSHLVARFRVRILASGSAGVMGRRSLMSNIITDDVAVLTQGRK
jgi:hypothetical protein